MQVQFKNALFDSAAFNFAVVNGTSLIIVTDSAEIELDFSTADEALEAQAELADLLNEVNSSSDLTAGLASAVDTVASLFGGLFAKGKTKVSTAKATTTSRVDVVVSDLLATLEEALNPAATAAPTAPTGRAAKTSAAEANDVFGTNRTSRTDAADTVIADLTDAALRTAINDKADHLIANDARVQEMVAQLNRFYPEDQVAAVIAQRKDQVFRLAKANSSLTVNQLFAEILRG